MLKRTDMKHTEPHRLPANLRMNYQAMLGSLSQLLAIVSSKAKGREAEVYRPLLQALKEKQRLILSMQQTLITAQLIINSYYSYRECLIGAYQHFIQLKNARESEFLLQHIQRISQQIAVLRKQQHSIAQSERSRSNETQTDEEQDDTIAVLTDDDLLPQKQPDWSKRLTRGIDDILTADWDNPFLKRNFDSL